MSGTSIFDPSSSSPNDRTRERRAKGKKNRLFSRTGERSESESAVPKEWIVPSLEGWSIDWSSYSPTPTLYEPSVRSTVRDLPLSLRAGIQPSNSPTSSHQGRSGRRSYQSSGSWLDLSPGSEEPPTPRCETEQYLEQLPPVKMGRFYRTTSLKHQLTGPEDYVSWAEEMQNQLSQGNAWPIIAENMEPVPTDSKYYTRWRQLNNKAWFLLITNVSGSIRRELCTSWAWDACGSWSYLREKYGVFAATMTRSVQGVHDLTSLRYEDCASLSEFLGKMKQCIRVIECNRPEREIDGWLWCRFILAKLGPQWESWVSDYMLRMQGRESSALPLGTVDQLLLDIEAEGARRVRASRYIQPKS